MGPDPPTKKRNEGTSTMVRTDTVVPERIGARLRYRSSHSIGAMARRRTMRDPTLPMGRPSRGPSFFRRNGDIDRTETPEWPDASQSVLDETSKTRHPPSTHSSVSVRPSRVFALVAMVVAAFAWAAPTAAAEPNWPPLLIIATASPGGTYHVYGRGLAKLLTGALDLPVVEQTTEGPRENIQLIEAGDAQLGFVTMGVALQAWNGSGDWTNGRQYREMRALFPMYDTPFHFVALEDTNIRSLADMAGKRIGVGPETGTAGTYVPRFLSALNIDATLSHGAWDDLAAHLEEGTIDVLAVAGGVPFPAVAALEAKNEIRYVAPTPEEILELRLAIPELTASVIPPGSYPSLMTSYQTVGLYNFAVADKDLPSDLVYRIVDAVFTHQQEMIDVHPAAAATIPANFVYNTFLPYHPGALRYYGNAATTGVVRAD